VSIGFEKKSAQKRSGFQAACGLMVWDRMLHAALKFGRCGKFSDGGGLPSAAAG